MSSSEPSTPREPRTPASQHRTWATAAEWERHRERITDLYRDQGLHLDEVIAIMNRDHEFYANHRMYKTRIKKWGIDKNQKASEVAHMLRLKRAREMQGKATEFVVRGRKVDWGKIEQYLKRDPILVRKLQHNNMNGTAELVIGHSAGIICRTPSPDPVKMMSVPFAPLAAADLRLPEEIAMLTRNYFHGAIESGMWREVEDRTYVSLRGMEGSIELRDWAVRMRSARYMMGMGDIIQGFRELGQCMDEMRPLIRDQDPSLLFHMLGNTLGLSPNSRDLGAALCKHIKLLSAIMLGDEHPIPRIFEKMSRLLNTVAHYGAVSIPIRCMMELFEAKHGAPDMRTINAHKRLVRLLQAPPPDPESPPADDGPELHEMVEQFGASVNIHESTRFSTAYLTHVADLARQKSESDLALNLVGEADTIVRFQEAKYFYAFHIEVMKSAKHGSFSSSSRGSTSTPSTETASSAG